ncbi:MAG: uroporphyrinogen decarboxylase [Verrucomicrobia bacterium]|nr:uroporphyrinogen decarboxylase [Verrucomicrobiota bacterium]
MSHRQRFLNACHCRAVDRPPIWIMRQAGRALPEYRQLKEKHSFLELVRTPSLAAEVTLQPVRRFGFDAAILFSDILVVPEALGQSYQFRDTGGIAMEFAVRAPADLARLNWGAVRQRLGYVADAVRLAKTALGGETALLGFSGSPWTLANFMMEGGSAETFQLALRAFREDPAWFQEFLGHLTAAVTDYLQMQIDAGVDALQIFDTLGGLLPAEDFELGSARWMAQIIRSLRDPVPVLVFAKGANQNWEVLVATGASVVGVDWTVRLAEVRRRLPEHVGIQGNLDPAVLTSTAEAVQTAATGILTEMRGRNGFIFNLGHGLPPAASIENIAKLVETVHEFKWVN